MDAASKDTLRFGLYWSSLFVLCTMPYAVLCAEPTFNAIIETNTGKSILFFSLAGIFKSVMDTLQFHYDKSVWKNSYHKFWNPKISWENKYKDLKTLERKKWLGIPIPVMFTDGWHLFQSFQITSLFLGVVFYEPTFHWAIDFIVYRFIYVVFFYIFYTYFLIKDENI